MFLEQISPPVVDGVAHVCELNLGKYWDGLCNRCDICKEYVFQENSYLNPQNSSLLLYKEFDASKYKSLWQRIKGLFK